MRVGPRRLRRQAPVTVYKQGQYQGKPDTQPWDNDQFKGDKVAWENAIKRRNDGQNEYSRATPDGQIELQEERMVRVCDMRAVIRLGFVFLALLAAQPALAADESGAAEQAERQVTQPLNNAPVWRDVRGGENPYQTTQVRGIETNVLVQSRGETWRQLRPVDERSWAG